MNGRTMLPFRAIFETLGAKVSWDADSQTVTGVRGDTTIQMQIGNQTATVNGSSTQMDVAPVIVSGRTLVPVRFVAEALPGVTVTWNGDTQTASIVDPNWPHRGGAASLAMWSAPSQQFNPIIETTTYDAWVTALLFDGLYMLDAQLAPHPNLASSWEISDDNLTYTFHLRHDVRWHDGEPFTSADVRHTLEAIMAPGYAGPDNSGFDALIGYDDFHSGKAASVTGIQTPDDYTISFQLKQVNASFFLNNLGFGIVPWHLYRDVKIADWGTSNDPNNLHPVGTGPFVWSSYAASQYYILDRNPNYFNGAPYLDRVIWKVLPQDTSLAYLQTGEVDLADVDRNSIATAQTFNNIHIVEYPDLVFQGLWFNLRPGHTFSDKAVRQAAAYAIDKNAIINDLLKGHAGVMYTTIHPLTWAYTDNIPHYDFNPDKARAILDADGWVVGSDGVRVKDGQKLHVDLYYPTGNKVRMASAPVIQKYLQDVGFAVDFHVTDFTTMVNTVGRPNYPEDAWLMGFSVNAEPDQLLLWGKDQIGPDLFNMPAWYDPQAEQLLHDGLATNDIEKRKQIYAEWQKIYMDDVPSIMLYAPNTIYGVNNRLHNFKPAPGTGGQLWNIWEWWVDG